MGQKLTGKKKVGKQLVRKSGVYTMLAAGGSSVGQAQGGPAGAAGGTASKEQVSNTNNMNPHIG